MGRGDGAAEGEGNGMTWFGLTGPALALWLVVALAVLGAGL